MKLIVTCAAALLFIVLSSTSLASSKAIDTAIAAFQKYGKQVTSISVECLSFAEEGSSDVNVIEKHGGKCGGDPVTSPSVAHLRVKGKKVLILEPVSGEYKVFNSKYKPDY